MFAEGARLCKRFHSSNRPRWARHRPLSSARRSSFVGVPALPLFAVVVSVVWWDGQAGAPPCVLSLRCAFGRAVPALRLSKAAAHSRRATLRRIWVRKIAPFGEDSAAAAPQPLSCTSKSRQCQGQSRRRRCIRILDIVGISMFASAYEVRRRPVGNTDECLQMPILRHYLLINTKCRCIYTYSGIWLEDNNILETPKGVKPSYTPISRWARRRSL